MATALQIFPRAVDSDGHPHILTEDQILLLVERLCHRPEITSVTPRYPSVRITTPAAAGSILPVVLRDVEAVGGAFLASREEGS